MTRMQTGGKPAPRGSLVIAPCRGAGALGRALARHASRGLAGARVLPDVDFAFPDGETGVRLAAGVEGRDVFLLQSLFDPASPAGVDHAYLALLIAARACREAGAAHVGAVVPYLSYARQDKPTPGEREPTTAKLMADLAAAAGLERLVTWHPHCAQIQGFYAPLSLVAPDPLPFFAREFARFAGRDDVIAVAPDEGAARLVGRLGRALGLRCAVASKHRPRGGRAEVTEVIGDFAGARTAIVVDDMVSSGGTLSALAEALAEHTPVREIRLAASHNLCRPAALEVLRGLHGRGLLARAVFTDSVPPTPELRALPFAALRPLAADLAAIVRAVHLGRPLPAAAAPRQANVKPEGTGSNSPAPSYRPSGVNRTASARTLPVVAGFSSTYPSVPASKR